MYLLFTSCILWSFQTPLHAAVALGLGGGLDSLAAVDHDHHHRKDNQQHHHHEHHHHHHGPAFDADLEATKLKLCELLLSHSSTGGGDRDVTRGTSKDTRDEPTSKQKNGLVDRVNAEGDTPLMLACGSKQAHSPVQSQLVNL